VAYQNGDWDVEGNPQHKEVVANAIVPSMDSTEAGQFCNRAPTVLCYFGAKHKKWYEFIRRNLPKSRMIAVRFEERFDDSNTFAKKKIANALPRAFQSVFLEEMGLVKFTSKVYETADLSGLSSQTSAEAHHLLKPPGILIGVTTNRKNFETRVASITRTWGDARNLPPNIDLIFFVGDHKGEFQYESGSTEDIINLTEQAGGIHPSKVIVLRGINDDEYPLMRKASEILKRLSKFLEDGTTKLKKIDWVMDVDDDTYVNVIGLEEFVSKRDHEQHAYFGRRGIGRPEHRKFISSPYCMGGPGILFSRPTLTVLAKSIDSCEDEAEKHGVPSIDDVVIGKCVHDVIGIDCSDGLDDDKHTFYQNTLDELPEKKMLNTVSMHQFKKEGTMIKQHIKFVDLYRLADN